MNLEMVAQAIHGFVAPGFEAVRREFERNFAERGEIGAAVAVYHRGQKVVDLWGGYRHRRKRLPWEEHTMAHVFSTTKGLAAMTLAVAQARGWLDYEANVAIYWPEFAQNGKENITVRQLLGHEAGLCVLDRSISPATLADPGALADILARQKPVWEPGTKHGYHGLTLGWYMGALLRKVDPRHRSLGEFFHDEIATPLDLEFYIGLPRDVPDSRIAAIRIPSLRDMFRLDERTKPITKAFLNPRSLAFRGFTNLRGNPLTTMTSRDFLAVENPAFIGIGEARAIARAYGAFAAGGSELGISPATLDALAAPPVLPPGGLRDAVLGVDVAFSLGFMKPFPSYEFGSSERAFGMPGAGGSLGFADPDAEIGYGYVMNRLGVNLLDDPREAALRAAVYRCLGN